ncbi:hypothetical protein [Streptomyces sp. NBC_01483]|uniref:hypothetical protein n=1 Tax=Streptomyces sp. NBC_01483 TaxID=2903883 RepID=UPI002E3520BF|nr:hypothetical protein [Streptomyces sp. NBC_01483]
MIVTKTLSPSLGVAISLEPVNGTTGPVPTRTTTLTTQERFRYTHDRRVGDLAVWDNTGMPRRALPYGADAERTLQRTAVVGDEELS